MDSENEVVVYNNTSAVQSRMYKSPPGIFGTENPVMSHEQSPLHEEYMLSAARDKFKRDTQQFFNNALLQDLKESKDIQLKNIDKNELFLKHSETLLENLCKHRKKFDERSYIFLARSRHEIKKLHQDCRCISEEVTQGRETIRALFYPFNK